MNSQKMLLSKNQAKRKIIEPGIMERLSPLKFTDILPTTTNNKVDVFKTFRPKLDEILDYNISETGLEMEHKGTVITYKETKAEYVPAPEELVKKHQMRKIILHSHGGPPQRFINEVWLEKQDDLQNVYKKEFDDFVTKRKKRDTQKSLYKQALTQSLVGPEWYQELSPKQIKTVDELDNCVQSDRKNNTICLTKEAIARLGLVCRPHHNKIKLALRYCCGCPVEFLFILYQLLDPARKKYSLNDRLLLSAVVHLTMTQTLKELHVRIPSPQKHKHKENNHKKSIPKKKKEVSPYLVPYTYKPEPAKFTGIYRKKHIQYPESPYFSYIENMKIEKQLVQDVSNLEPNEVDENEKELVEDTIEAQKIYNRMHNTDVVLLKPTIVKMCFDYENYKDAKSLKESGIKKEKIKLPPLPALGVPQIECQCPSEIIVQQENLDGRRNNCKTTERKKPQISSFCDHCSWKKVQANVNGFIVGIAVIECKEAVPIHGGLYFDTNCSCKEKFEDEVQIVEAQEKFENLNQKYIINGVVLTNIGPVYYLSVAIWRNRLKKLLKMSVTANNCEDKSTQSNSDQKQSVPEKSCPCKNVEFENNIVSDSEISFDDTCHCERELDIFLKNKCTCEVCNVERRRKEATYILSGLQELESEPPLNIVSGVQECQCSCLTNYLSKMKRVEEYRRRCQAAYDLKKKGLKYALGGVTQTEKGPIYQISGIRPPVQCICGEVLTKAEQLKDELKRQPKMPPTGRIKYEICGVKQNSTENVYIISQALETEECECEKLYEQFMSEHTPCWKVYQDFVKEMETGNDEYRSECVQKVNDNPEEINSTKQSVQKTNFEQDIEKHDIPIDSCVCTHQMSDIRNSLNQKNVLNYKNGGTDFCVCLQEEVNQQPSKKYQTQIPDLSINKVSDQQEKCSCKCNESDSLQFDSNYAIKLNFEKLNTSPAVPPPQLANRHEQQEEIVKLKRFMILKEIPHKIQSQREILKDVLAVMADDGFPLAKLPDSYKLPHFKLWMELRSGRKWTQEDRKSYEKLSMFAWEQAGRSKPSIVVPSIKISPEIQPKITWNSAERYRNLIKSEINKFHRKIKQHLITETRNFFPSVFVYEFPSPQFRKYFFAYLPNKEEDVVLPSI